MQLNVDIRAEALLARLRGSTDRLSQNMVRVVTRLSVEVQAAVKDKLTGQVLHVRTGTLRRSINRKVETEGGNTVATIGTNVAYAGVHEFGFDGNVTVKAHTRKIPFPSARRPVKNPVQGSAASAKAAASSQGVANVREYTRHMVMPERSFLRSTLREYTPRIRSELRAAALEALL